MPRWLKRMRNRVEESFRSIFGKSPEFVTFAPGRVNIIGEHTDYNGGLVLPAAIQYGTYVALSRAVDGKIEVYSEAEGWERWKSGEFPRRGNFGDYLRGVLKFSKAPPSGLRVYITSDLPIGGGLSSSASLEVAFALAVDRAFSLGSSGLGIVELSHGAETEFVGVNCGIMDQFVSFFAEQNHLLLLRTSDLQFEHIPFPENLSIALVDTGIRRALSSSEYNRRRQECQRALAGVRRLYPEVENLSMVDEEMLFSAREYIDPVAFKRAVHVISENQRVLQLVDFLRDGDLCMVEKIMKLAHESLSEDFEVSLPEIDALVEEISSLPFVYGARLTGAGFGGFVVALVLKGKEEELRREFPSRTVLFSRPWHGARVIYP